MPSVVFKKMMLGKWRRDDGESKKLVNEESMYREMEKLVKDGWEIMPIGITQIRSYELVKD
jgi:hypothetical protein